jgi:predicted dehydrogenase
MKIDFHGKLSKVKTIRAGFIGCGSHSFRNIYPVFQFVPVELAAVCDLSLEKAAAYQQQFGAERAYSDYREMLRKERLEAVFIVTGYDPEGRPLYPQIAIDCMNAGCHVWMEKPPAASCSEIETMKKVSEKTGRNVLVGLKKMFFPSARKARQLMESEDFGKASLLSIQYPQYIPTMDEFKAWEKGVDKTVVSFLDHLCHPASLLIYLFGMPSTLYCQRSFSGSGIAVFGYEDGKTASITFTHGGASNCGMERTLIVSEKSRHIVVDNNIRVFYHRNPPLGYGDNPDYFKGAPEETSSVWEPEFSLGQLYNKGIFLLGYYDEVNEFAKSVLDGRKNDTGTLDDAWNVTRLFEAFMKGPGKLIRL